MITVKQILKWCRKKEKRKIKLEPGNLYIWDGIDHPGYFGGHCGLTDNPIFYWPHKIGNASWTIEELIKMNIRKC